MGGLTFFPYTVEAILMHIKKRLLYKEINYILANYVQYRTYAKYLEYVAGVIPAQAGIQSFQVILDSLFRGDDRRIYRFA
jgi:hypothetical protein